MNIDTKNMETFIQVAELCSFTKAAKKLGYSQSTVSFQIRQLEEMLNVRLLVKWYFPSSGKNSIVPSNPSPVSMAFFSPA